MSQHPEVEAYIVDAIASIRRAGGAINSVVVCSFFRGILKAKHPELFKKYRFSRDWCLRWFARTFAWTWKRATSSGQKVPLNWEEQVAGMAKRVSGAAAQYDIVHACFVINWDQTGLVLLPSHKYTFEHVKEKHTALVGQEEKRQITAVVASALSGEMLPLQLIFTGQDKNKKEQRAVPTLSEVTAKRTRNWHLTQTHNHWSTLESMKDYIRLIIKPWVDAKGREHGILNPHCILLIDCWSVHTSQEFRTWMDKAYPDYHRVFVPAGCTGKAQPADVVLQRPFKNHITNAFNTWMTDEIHLTVKGGVAPQDVRVDTGLKKLKPHLVHWAWSSWDKLTRKQDMVKEGWSRCGLAGVLEEAQKMEAMRFCLSNKEGEPGEEAEEQPDTCSDAEDEFEEGVDSDMPMESD